MAFLSPLHPPPFLLKHIPKVRILPIRQIIKPMRCINLRPKLPILLVIPVHQIPPQEQDNHHQHAITAKVYRQRLDVARRIAVEEDLRPCGIARAPREEVHRDADGFLGLPAHVARQHGHAQPLRGPEGEDDPVGD